MSFLRVGKMQSYAIEVKDLMQQVRDADRVLSILECVNLQAAPGEALAIMGSSGSGKSTLLGLMAGLDVPTSGQVRLLGHDLFVLDEEARAALRARHVGFVFQSFQLLPNLNALENVMLPLELRGVDKPRKQAQEALARMGLQGHLHHYPRTLSGGEQQRVSLARAFVMHPDILFADEPTGSLDADNGNKVADLLFEQVAEQGTTLILVTHDSALAARCGRVVTLAGGRLVS